MANDWKVVGKDSNSLADMALLIGTGGISGILGVHSDTTYTIRDENGIEKEVSAQDLDDLGEKISNGEFDD